MDKLDTMKSLLAQLDMPVQQQGRLCALTLLAMAGLKPETPWSEASNEWIRIHDIILFLADNYDIKYAENSRETIRKEALHRFIDAALAESNGKPTNHPQYGYRLTNEFVAVIRQITSADDLLTGKHKALNNFKMHHDSLRKIYSSKKRLQKMPVRINHRDFELSAGAHNQLQKAVIEEFAPRFAPNSECLYIGDTAKKNLVMNTQTLTLLGVRLTVHDKMPDVVLYREEKDWLYFIECVKSVGPMSPERVNEIKALIPDVHSGIVYVTAFPDFNTYKRFSHKLAWDTEVWIADFPEHLIHYNGDKFQGPRED